MAIFNYNPPIPGYSNLPGHTAQPGSHTSVVQEDDTELETTAQKTVAELLPKRDRSRDMGPHTECFARGYEDSELCTNFRKNSQLKVCRYLKFEFMCGYTKGMG